MKTTLALLARAQESESDVKFCVRLGLNRTTLVMARKAGRLSPDLAARVAAYLGEPVAEWTAIAAAEQLPEPKRTWLMQQLTAVFVVGVVALTLIATPYSATASETEPFVLCKL